jgi:WD40 repeat protein
MVLAMMGERASGETIGPYRIVRTIGRGGLGITYEAEPPKGVPVALKELRLSQVGDWKVVELFEREARVLAALDHPAIPKYVAHFSVEETSGPVFFLAQELAGGKSLEELVAGGWRASEAEAHAVAEALLGVLDYLHGRTPPVYHRDIKPRNVLREPSGKVWLVDFGAVRDIHRSTTLGGSTVAGTFGYMAPEQLHGVARPESDLYGLGATLLYVLSGQSPGQMPQTKLKPDFRSRVKVSPLFAAWLEKMLEPAPEDRFRTAREALEGLRTPAVPPRALSSAKRTAVLASVLLFLLGVVGVVFALDSSRAHGSRPPQIGDSKLPERPGVWSFPRLRWVRNIPAHMSAIHGTAFTPDGARLLTASFDFTAKIWDTRSGQSLMALPGHTGRLAGVGVTRDGRLAITGGDTTVRVWGLPDGKLVRTFDTGAGVFSIDVAPSGTMLVTGGGDGKARVWSIQGGDPLAVLAHGTARVLSASFSPDGSRLVTAGEDQTIRVWTVADWTLRQTLVGHAGAVNDARIGPDGQTLASASDDRTIKLWHVDSGKLMSTIAADTDEIWALAFSPDGGTLVSGGKASVLEVWGLPSTQLLQKWPLDAGRKILDLGFAPDGVTFAAAYGNGTVDIWQIAKGGTHLPLPDANVVAKDAPPPPTPEKRAYREAMDLVDGYGGDRKRLDEARAKLRAALSDTPRSALMLAGLARVSFVSAMETRDSYDSAGLAEAIDFAEQAIAIDPSLPDGYIVLGWAAYKNKEPARARSAAAKAIHLAPHMQRAVLLAAELAIDNGDLDGAEKLVRDALASGLDARGAAGAFGYLADIYWRAGDFDASEQARRREIQLNPTSAWAKGNLADFLIYKGDYDGAIDLAKQALSIMEYGKGKRTLADAECMKGERLLWDHGDADGAERLIREALAVDPTGWRPAYDMGARYQLDAHAHENTRSTALARDWYQKAAGLDTKGDLPKKALLALEK